MLSVRVENLATRRSVEHTFPRSPVRMGRNALNELTLDERYVSLSHAVLRFDPEKIQVIDLGSTNGTLVDGKRIESNVPVTIHERSDLRIGDLRIHVARALANHPTPMPEREHTQFRLATQDVRAAVRPGSQAAPAPGRRPDGTARVAAPPTVMVPPAARTPGTGTAPVPSPVDRDRSVRVGPSHAGAQPDASRSPPGASRSLPAPGWPGAPSAEADGGGANGRDADAADPLAAVLAQAPAGPHLLEERDPNATVIDVQAFPLGAGPDGSPAAPVDPGPALAESVVAATFPLYVEYRKAWKRVRDALQQHAGALGAPQRAALADALEQQMPALDQEEEFRAFAGRPATSGGAETGVRARDASSGGSDTSRLLTLFADTYSARSVRLSTPKEVDAFLDRVAEVLETFATAFIELRRGQAEFGNQIAVRTVTSDTPLRRARSARELLHLLLETGPEGELQLDDLKAGFGEVMFHQVAFLSGTREGVKALLEELDPAQLAKPPATANPPPSKLAYLWPALAWTRWKRFSETWRALGEEEQALRILFGPEFARAYALVMGGQLGPGKKSGTSGGPEKTG